MWIKIKLDKSSEVLYIKGQYRDCEATINTDNIAYLERHFRTESKEFAYYIECVYSNHTKTFRVYERYYNAVENYLLTGQYVAPEDVDKREPTFQLIDLMNKDYYP